MISKRQLYAAGEMLGDSVTRVECGRRIYGGGGGSGGQSTTVQSIPDELKPLASAYTQKAMGLSDQPYQAYTGDRFADLNQVQLQGLQNTVNRATQGSPVMDQANQTLINTLQGGQTNPYLDSLVNKAQQNVIGNYNTATVGSGSFGNAGLQNQLGQNLGDVATQMYGNAYNTDRANQMQALGMAQSYGNQAYTDASQLLNAGQTLQDQSQQQQDFDYQQYLEQQNLPYKQLAAMSGVFGSGLGSTSTTTQDSGGK